MYFKVVPSEVESLMRTHGVPEEDWAKTMNRISHLQEIDNKLRPMRAPAPPKVRRRTIG